MARNNWRESNRELETMKVSRVMAVGALAVAAVFGSAAHAQVGGTTGGPLVAPTYRIGSVAVIRVIYDKWVQSGAWNGPMGSALGGERMGGRSPQGTRGSYVPFVGGSITRIFDGSYRGRVCVVRGGINEMYSSMGGSGSWLGWPISDEFEFDDRGADAQQFEGGVIRWSHSRGQFEAVTY
jgi:uncharacterized protein with LGFP repeats